MQIEARSGQRASYFAAAFWCREIKRRPVARANQRNQSTAGAAARVKLRREARRIVRGIVKNAD